MDSVAEDGRILVRLEDDKLKGFEEAVSFAPRELTKFFEVGGAAGAARAGRRGCCVQQGSLQRLGWLADRQPWRVCEGNPTRPASQNGEHVKVVHGEHSGETGLVLRVEGPVCVVFTDASQKEVRVFSRDLVAAVAVASSLDS